MAIESSAGTKKRTSRLGSNVLDYRIQKGFTIGSFAVRKKSDYCALSGPEMFLRRARNGKRIFRVPYSNLAPTLEGFETGLSVHAVSEDDSSNLRDAIHRTREMISHMFCAFGSGLLPRAPKGWNLIQSKTTGRFYLYNPETGESRWEVQDRLECAVARPLTSYPRCKHLALSSSHVLTSALNSTYRNTREERSVVSVQGLQKGKSARPCAPTRKTAEHECEFESMRSLRVLALR
eukprot:762958-Hanusia_phi.AAC.7